MKPAEALEIVKNTQYRVNHLYQFFMGTELPQALEKLDADTEIEKEFWQRRSKDFT